MEWLLVEKVEQLSMLLQHDFKVRFKSGAVSLLTQDCGLIHKKAKGNIPFHGYL